MTKMKYMPSLLLLLICLSACDKMDTPDDQSANTDNQVTETVLDDVDSIEGTISDAMINVEELDNSAPPEITKEKGEEDSSTEQADDPIEESE